MTQDAVTSQQRVHYDDWMVHTLKPQIDRDLRTLSDREHTFIAGSSMGGLMSLYAVAQYNSVFGRAAALSPSVWTNVDKLEQLIRRTKIRQNTVIYMDYGSVELEQRPKIRRDFERIAAAFFQKKVLLEARIIPGGTHCEASWERQIPFFMKHFCTRNKEMEVQYRKEYSPALGRDMECKIYGHKGRPVLFIPCQDGRFLISKISR